MLKRNRTIIIGPAVVINHSQAERLGSKNGNKCTFTLEFQQRKESKAENRGLRTGAAQLKNRKQNCKMMDRFYFRLLWTLTFLQTEREDNSLN